MSSDIIDINSARQKRAKPDQRISVFLESIGIKPDGAMVTAFCSAVVTAWCEGANTDDVIDLVSKISDDESPATFELRAPYNMRELEDCLALSLYSGCHLASKRGVSSENLQKLARLVCEIAEEIKLGGA